jgi:hypothetical protein
MKEEVLPEIIKRKDTKSLYISEYTLFYLMQKAKEFNSVVGATLDKIILAQPDFKDTINRHLEESKL